MPVEMGLWRVDDKPVRLTPGGMPTEARLEELIEAEPTILGEPLLIIGRQVTTSFGKVIDLLAVDADGVLHVLELKKDKSPRSWIMGHGLAAWPMRMCSSFLPTTAGEAHSKRRFSSVSTLRRPRS
jgi:hypothetical protein